MSSNAAAIAMALSRFPVERTPGWMFWVMQKPSAINEENNSKENAKATIETGSMAKRMAKGTESMAASWLDSNKLLHVSGDIYKYVEYVTEKPGEADPQNLFSGEAYVVFHYSGLNPTLATINLGLVTDIDSFCCYGLENKTWKGELDSIRIKAAFSNTTVDDLKPGTILAWGKNVSDDIAKGRGDTAYFTLDSLDDTEHTQYGRGGYFDAHTGGDNSGESYSFDFSLIVYHKNTLDPSKPYERWEDNEGDVMFTIPWGKNGSDHLYFVIHFYPNYQRSGTIQKNNADGPVLVRFTHNEKTGAGETIYYDEDGKEIGRE